MDLRYPSHHRHPRSLHFKEFLVIRNLFPHGGLAEGSPERHGAVHTWWEESGIWCVVDQPFQLVIAAAVPITGIILGLITLHVSCGNKVSGQSSGVLSYKWAVSHTLSEDTHWRLQERENTT